MWSLKFFPRSLSFHNSRQIASGGDRVEHHGVWIWISPFGLQHTLSVHQRLALLCVMVRVPLGERRRTGVRVLYRPWRCVRQWELQSDGGAGPQLPTAVWAHYLRPLQPDHSKSTSRRCRKILLSRRGVAPEPTQCLVSPRHKQLWGYHH